MSFNIFNKCNEKWKFPTDPGEDFSYNQNEQILGSAVPRDSKISPFFHKVRNLFNNV